jgi:hypothetical protein
MNVVAISDIHLERRGLEEVPALTKTFGALICAGDVWEGEPENTVRSVVQLACGKPAILVPGNHDLYSLNRSGNTISDVLKRMRSEADRQNAHARREIVTVLSADDPVCEIEQVRFIGLTLWADWAQAGRWMGASNDIECAARARAEAGHPKAGPREFGAIRTERGGWTPYDAVAEHAREKAILLDELVTSHDGPTVVVTHYPPLPIVSMRIRPSRFDGGPPRSTRLISSRPYQSSSDLTFGYVVMFMCHLTLSLVELVCSVIPSKVANSTRTWWSRFNER